MKGSKGSKPRNIGEIADEQVKEVVRKTYAKVATLPENCCNTICCDVPFIGGGTALAKILGYDVKNLPNSVTESFAGCGNPVALSDIREGETVLDLGSGSGLDVFMAAWRVGDKGKVIGIDMTPEMIEKAKMNAYKLGIKNVEFKLGDIENMPIEDETIDVIISNCVINLTPNKYKAFREAYRVLKPGGRMYISDIVKIAKLPKRIEESIEAYAACVSGALEEKEYIKAIKHAGFVNVEITDKANLGYVASDKIRAYKPKNGNKGNWMLTNIELELY